VKQHEPIMWRCAWDLVKYRNENCYWIDLAQEVIQGEGNLLMHGGASALFNRLVSSSPSVGVFDNSNAYIGVGDSSTAAAATQTDLQAVTNKFRKGMDATYPQHTDGTGTANDDCIFRATFGATDANFTWNEWGIFNASAAGRMLNRKVTALGTKVNPAVWQFTVTLTLA
jgi:hypothetical protein